MPIKKLIADSDSKFRMRSHRIALLMTFLNLSIILDLGMRAGRRHILFTQKIKYNFLFTVNLF